MDKKYQCLVDKGGNLLNENSSFESRLGGNIFFFKKIIHFSAYKKGFLSNQASAFCPPQPCVFSLPSPELGKFVPFCLTRGGAGGHLYGTAAPGPRLPR